MAAQITPAELAQGGWYALEQCGHLLSDAVSLFDLGRYATAASLAMLAREEYGKARELFRLAAAGQDVDPDVVAMEDHIEQQAAGRVSVMLRSADSNTGVGNLLQQVLTHRPGTPEREAADKTLDEIVQRQARRLPEDRHLARMRSLYVD